MNNEILMMEYKSLENLINGVKTDVSDMRTTVNDILHLLTGTSLNKDSGLIHTVKDQATEVERLTVRIQKLEKWKDRAVFIAIGMGIPTTYGTLEIMKQLFK